MSTTQELNDWLNGTATGGPNSDGRYPLTGSDGVTVLVLCPAAEALNNPADPTPVEVFVDAAAASAADADTSRIAAASSAASAHTDAQTATTKAGEATAAASTATTKAGEASASAAAAASSASTATTKANDAAASATDAASSASSATDSAAEAHSWALTAQSSATGLLRYMPGGWDASTGAFPTDPPTGGFWKITKAGVIGGVDLAVGDQIIWSGSGWDKIDNTESVTSVAGRVGAVTLSIADVAELQTTLDGKATSAQGAKADTAVQPGQSLSLTAADGQITLSSPGQRQIGIVSTQTPRVGFYDITNSTWLLKIEADNSTTFAGSIAVNTYLNSSTANMVMSSSGAGGAVYLRPAGPGSTAGQLFVSTGGISWDGKSLWHSGNFDPSTKANANNAAFTGTMTLPTGAGTCTIAPGTGDGASYTTYNFKISSWWGIGFASYDGSINGFYDARAGRWDTKGGYRVNGQDVWYPGNFDPAAKANANAVVDLSSAQPIGGNKTFISGSIRVQGWSGAADSGVVYLGSGDRYIYKPTGVNRFEFRIADGGAGSAFLDAGGTIWTSGNFNPGNYVTTASIGTAAAKNTGDFAASTSYGGGNLNTLLTSGIYRLNDNVTNGPTSSLWGQLLVLHGGGDTQAQQYFPYASSDVYTRGGSSNGATWLPWVKHWHSGNLDPASFATAAQGVKADAAVPAANLSGFTKFAVVTALPGSPDPNTIYFVK